MEAINFIDDYEKISQDDKHATYFHARTMFEFAEDYHQAKLNLLTIPGVSKSVVCGNCDGYGYTVDENGRRKEHCNECEQQQIMFANDLAMNSNGLIITKLNKYVQNQNKLRNNSPIY